MEQHLFRSPEYSFGNQEENLSLMEISVDSPVNKLDFVRVLIHKNMDIKMYNKIIEKMQQTPKQHAINPITDIIKSPPDTSDSIINLEDYKLTTSQYEGQVQKGQQLLQIEDILKLQQFRQGQKWKIKRREQILNKNMEYRQISQFHNIPDSLQNSLSHYLNMHQSCIQHRNPQDQSPHKIAAQIFQKINIKDIKNIKDQMMVMGIKFQIKLLYVMVYCAVLLMGMLLEI